MDKTFNPATDNHLDPDERFERTLKHLKRAHRKIKLVDFSMKAIVVLLCIVAFAVLIAACGALFVYEGWVLTKVWEWLVVPHTKWPALPLALAVGVFLLRSLLSAKSMYRNAVKQENFALSLVFTPTLILGFAWLAKTFL